MIKNVGDNYRRQVINAERWYSEEVARLQREGFVEVAPGIFEKGNVSVGF